ncbi:MAG: hypothetical protein R3B57_10465 [Phycisphaerales bacterium]
MPITPGAFDAEPPIRGGGSRRSRSGPDAWDEADVGTSAGTDLLAAAGVAPSASEFYSPIPDGYRKGSQ